MISIMPLLVLYILYVFVSVNYVCTENITLKHKNRITPSKIGGFHNAAKVKPSQFQISNLLDEIESVSNATDLPINATNGDDEFTTLKISFETTTTTSIDNTSITMKSDVTTTETPIIKKLNETRKSSMDCHCDLLVNSCDINCCCDNDCSSETIQSFPRCNDHQKGFSNYNPQYCYSHEIFYKSNSPFVQKAYIDNLFCILKENLPPKILTNQNRVIKTKEEMIENSKSFYKWSQFRKTDTFKNHNMKQYSYGDKILFFYNGAVRTIDIPQSNYNAHCDSRRSITFLENSQTSCISSIANLEMFSGYETFDSYFYIQNPALFSESWVDENATCPRNVCFPIESYSCDLYRCQKFNGTEFLSAVSCDDVVCANIITSVKFVIFANGSGVVGLRVFFGVEIIQASNKYVTQKFDITTYLIGDFNSSAALPKHLSGNYGYIFGKPVIISYGNQSNESSQDIDTNVTYSSPLLTVLAYPKQIRRRCVISNITYNEIQFGENIKSNCDFLYYLPKNEKNATLLCNDLQDLISLQFLIKNIDQNMYLSSLGNPFKDTNEWIALLQNYKPNTISGNFSDTETLICHNMCTILRYEFAYGLRASHVTDDYVLLGGLKTCQYDENLDLDIIDNSVMTMLTVTSAFYDVSKPPIMEYAKGPHLNIHFSKDFFYPFMSSVPSNKIINKVFLVLSICSSMYLQ